MKPIRRLIPFLTLVAAPVFAEEELSPRTNAADPMATYRPPWFTESIADIEATNSILRPPEPPNPGHEALAALDRADTGETHQTSFAIPLLPLYDMEPGPIQEEPVESPILTTSAKALREARRWTRMHMIPRAIEELQAALPRVPEGVDKQEMLGFIGYLLSREKRYSEAAAAFASAEAIAPLDAPLACNYAATLLSLGQPENAAKLMEQLSIPAGTPLRIIFTVHFNRACAYSLMGQPDAAIAALEQAAETDAEATLAVFGDPQLDAARNYPRFQAIRDRTEQALANR